MTLALGDVLLNSLIGKSTTVSHFEVGSTFFKYLADFFQTQS